MLFDWASLSIGILLARLVICRSEASTGRFVRRAVAILAAKLTLLYVLEPPKLRVLDKV